MSALEAERRHYRPCVPAVLRVRVRAEPAQERTTCVSHEDLIASAFPTLYGSPVVSLVPAETDTSVAPRPLRVGCVLSGGTPAAGGHNCICGLFDHLEAFHPGSTLLGFRGGLRGVLRNSFTKLEAATVERHRNSGGFFMIGSGGDLIETEEELALAHYELAEATCRRCGLSGLVLVGGPVSNSDTALLAEHFKQRGVPTRVIGVPATIDGDLYCNSIEASIGFDTATRVYASLVGNLATDAASARKHWYFIRMMGRTPSHLTLGCANLTQPNIALVGEELEARRMTLCDIVGELADAVEARASEGKHFGVVLIPEGLIEYVPQVNALLSEISAALKYRQRMGDTSTDRYKVYTAILPLLTPPSAALLASLPPYIRRQLMLERQASDDKAQLSQIETERLLAELVRVELRKRRAAATATAEWAAPDARFAPVCFYLGYQARSSMPSTFDANLGYALGHAAGALVGAGATAYMASAHCLTSPPSEWRLCGVPLFSLMSADRRAGVAVAVIRPAQVSLASPTFRRWSAVRERLVMADLYCNPGPMQLSGPLAAGPSPGRVQAEHAERGRDVAEAQAICREVSAACWPGCSGDVLRTALASLRALREHLDVLEERDQAAMTNPVGSSHRRITQVTHEQMLRRDN
ncbi:hypothetical protein EMIHUDRAFT_427530 [Emiliania huxleyi CCMP1516]|uniref:Phosphofructokinase domain-containing protein n=2 Tax=Emiliania huxleyi TaxID=2903 RepID=A0A0D3IYF9_EMIH1|nr:hypothetical protein EMIHUDRAFT_427530 [Emiliania huxleyi CCMP1516]EOD16294.1 hypothetical protein EMIHUDRAFT_427530 [Emiliania huxleyi CCMP1516]|eukprot:XP_005768723.1 hypothetical protein EMIHUDRAFT_427530 [Emiliania huxleyi CCMP1516]